MPFAQTVITRADFVEAATARFGPDMLRWRFICPSCRAVASVQDWRDAGAPPDAVAFSCVGNWRLGIRQFTVGTSGARGCWHRGSNITMSLNPVRVREADGLIHRMFAFGSPA